MSNKRMLARDDVCPDCWVQNFICGANRNNKKTVYGPIAPITGTPEHAPPCR